MSLIKIYEEKESVKLEAMAEERRVLLVVLPYIVKPLASDTKKKSVRSFLAFPYGVITIASYVKKHARNNPLIRIVDLNVGVNTVAEKKFRDSVLDFDPDIIGFSMSYDVSFEWLLSLSKEAKTINSDICCVVGGPAVTTAYEEILSTASHIDAVCYSEGELGLKNLVESADIHEALTQSPWITKERLPTLGCKPEALYEDLDRVVDVDYSLIDINAYSMKETFSPFTRHTDGAKQFFIVTSRGCPFKCVFCAEPSFHGANMRYVSVDKVVDHVRKLVNEHGLTVLTIYDDQILMNKERAKTLFRGLRDLNIRIEMPNGVTMSYIDEEMANLMKSAGVDTIFLAIESGVKRVLQEIIKKPLAFDRVKPTIDILHQNEIFVCSFFGFGLPGETDAERRSNREFIIEMGIDWAFFNFATPLRGSELFRLCKENKWVDEKYLKLGTVDLTDYVIRAPGMDPDSIRRDMFEMNLDVNFVNNRRMRVGDYATALASFKEVISRHEAQPFAHYFAAAAMEKISGSSEEIHMHRNRFSEIITKDPEWRQVAEKFNLLADC